MMTDNNHFSRRAAERIDQIAASWVVRMHSDQCTTDDELAFDNWLRESPIHGEAYRSHLALWQGVAGLSEDARCVLRKESEALNLRDASKSLAFRRIFAAAAAILAALILVPHIIFQGTVYETAHGEQRMVVLDDGSRIMLNTSTRIRVDFTTKERRLKLDEGQAFFQVSKDAARPFRVFVDGNEVRAVGTAFEVYKEGSAARVILEEGMVALYRNPAGLVPRMLPVAAAARPKPEAILAPGQQAKLADAGLIGIANADVGHDAWREGRIVFENVSLAEAVAEINRYASQQIVLSEPSLGGLKISGVFHTRQPAAFIEAITRALSVRILSATAQKVVLGSSPDTRQNKL